jgi:hypothetical protein
MAQQPAADVSLRSTGYGARVLTVLAVLTTAGVLVYQFFLR